ncbi:Lon protease-like protein [Silvibacterium bohemicum]|uniref:Lon protease-like protein n=1 Tax=Silvibacterium bohemicum TaxID=1577686 RepID=A0A841JVZ6_9BACT|nr:LON peptidase substrate-binding domain-containing protein [Silvibacterium bohemicum]MBB6145320.1 Lon protease-like protein [Silvibacterium bohemicum]
MRISLFPLDVVLFPGTGLPLHIFEDRYKEMIGECMADRTGFGVVRAQQEGLAVIGCTAQIVRVLHHYDDGRLDIFCQGESRFEIQMLENSRDFLEAEVDFFDDEGDVAPRSLREACAALHFETLELAGIEMQTLHLSLDEPISFKLASALPADLGFKQQLLGLRSDVERTHRLLDFYQAILPKLRMGAYAAKASGQNGHVM